MDALDLDDRPVALIFRSPLFNASEGFIQRQAAGLTRYQPIFAGIDSKGNAMPELQGRLMLPANDTEKWRMIFAGDFSALGRRLALLRPRFVHAHFGTDGVRALALARHLKVPLITSLRGYDVQMNDAALLRSGRWSWMAYAFRRQTLISQGALFLAVSDALRARAIARGFPAERTLTLYNGVNLTRYRPDPEHRRERIVLHAGRLVEKKGTHLLIEAFARTAQTFPDTRLVILGEGPLRPALERQAGVQGIAARVTFAGHTAPDITAEWMRRAWFLAAPSVTGTNGDGEGLPNVVVEAAASGLPVVASRHAGIPEAVRDGVTGLLVPEGTVEPLAAAMRRLLGAPDTQAAFGRAARAFAEEQFDARRHIARLEDIYDRVSER